MSIKHIKKGVYKGIDRNAICFGVNPITVCLFCVSTSCYLMFVIKNSL